MAGSTHALPIADARARAMTAGPRVSPGLEAWRRFRRHRLAVASAAILGLIILSVVLGPLWWQVPINDIDFTARLASPSWQHPFGTDDLGQDLFARLLYGGRISLAVGLAAMLVAVIAGTIIGALAGSSRGSADAGLMWLTDLFLSLPQLPLLLLVIYLFRDSLKALAGLEAGIFILLVAVIGGFRWMPVARLVRAQFLSLREKEFVEAARALGAFCPTRSARSLSPVRLRSPPRSSRSRRCRSLVSAFRPTFPPGDVFSTTPRTTSTSRRTGRCFPAPRSFSPC
jgi:peptide/nickel transport system permease protein